MLFTKTISRAQAAPGKTAAALLGCVLAIALATVALTFGPAAQAAGEKPAISGVRVWEEDTVIPTYLIGDPEPNPIFYFGRQSQGAQGGVYAYPLYDNLTFQKTDKHYKIVYLDNEFVRIVILPEFFFKQKTAYEITNNYNFIYRQHVIKP